MQPSPDQQQPPAVPVEHPAVAPVEPHAGPSAGPVPPLPGYPPPSTQAVVPYRPPLPGPLLPRVPHALPRRRLVDSVRDRAATAGRIAMSAGQAAAEAVRDRRSPLAEARPRSVPGFQPWMPTATPVGGRWPTSKPPLSVRVAAIPAFFQGGLVLCSALVLVVIASGLQGLRALGSFGRLLVAAEFFIGSPAQYAALAIVDLALGPALITGAVKLTSGQDRRLLISACIANEVLAVLWLALIPIGFHLVAFMGIPPLITLVLALVPRSSEWMRAGQRR